MCPICESSRDNPRNDHWTNGCDSCKARALAVTGAHLIDDYRGAVKQVFGDTWKHGHTLVREWVDRLKVIEAREKAGA